MPFRCACSFVVLIFRRTTLLLLGRLQTVNPWRGVDIIVTTPPIVTPLCAILVFRVCVFISSFYTVIALRIGRW